MYYYGSAETDRLPANDWNAGQPTTNHSDKFQETRGMRDPLFVFLFVFHLLAVFLLVITGSAKGVDKSVSKDFDIPLSEYRDAIVLCLLCAGIGGFLSFVWLMIVQRYARALILGTLITSILYTLALGIYVLFYNVFYGVFILLLALLWGFLYYSWRNRIPFATAILQTVARLIQTYPATAYIAYFSLVLQLIWVLVWAYAVLVAQKFHTVTFFFGFFLLLSFYWTIQVIKNVVHVSVSGTFASWYFLTGLGSMPENPTMQAVRRACTTSFGSICLGSLLVAFLQTLKAIIRGIRGRRDNIVACIADCIISVLDNLLRYFNKYAFTQVAIYGKTFCQAARDTWELIGTHGVQAIINDNIISGVLMLGAILGGLFTALIGGIAGFVMMENAVAGAVFGFLIGFAMLILVMEVVDSGVATLFVCFAMDPEALRRTDPSLHQIFQTTYNLY